jgi:hypothetical protein
MAQFPTTPEEFEARVQEYKNSFPLGFDYNRHTIITINRYTIDNTIIPYDSKIVYLDMTVPCQLPDGITNDKLIIFINKISSVSGLNNYIVLNKTINSYLLGPFCNNLDKLYYSSRLLDDRTCNILFIKYSQFESLYDSFSYDSLSEIQKNALDIKLTELFNLSIDKSYIVKKYKNTKDNMFRLNEAFYLFLQPNNIINTPDQIIDLT